MTLVDQFGKQDVGIIFTFLLNILSAKRGEWFLINANEPHAYLQGELIESMINSDNVVRGGLTPKLKDTETLLSILPYESTQARETKQGVQIAEGVVEYSPAEFDELRLLKVQTSGEVQLPQMDCLAMLLVVSGSCQVGDKQLDKYSTWYAMPGQKLSVKSTSDEELLLFVASPLP